MISVKAITESINGILIDHLLIRNDNQSITIMHLLLKNISSVSKYITENVCRIAEAVATESGPHYIRMLDWLAQVNPSKSWRADTSTLTSIMVAMIRNQQQAQVFYEVFKMRTTFEIDAIVQVLENVLSSLHEASEWSLIIDSWITFDATCLPLTQNTLQIFLKAAYNENSDHLTIAIFNERISDILKFDSLPFADLGHLGKKEDIIKIYAEAWEKANMKAKFDAMLSSIDFS